MGKFLSSDHLNIIAKRTGFKQRSSLITPETFLNLLFLSNAQRCPTLSEYSVGLAYTASIEVSKQAIDKRFNAKTQAMLSFILQEIVSKQLRRATPLKNQFFSEIRIQDSTEFVAPAKLANTFPGYGGTGREAIVQVQLEYELIKGKVTELSLGSARDCDMIEGMKNISKIPRNALLIRDLGYFSPNLFEEIRKHDLYFVSRAKPQWSMYQLCDRELVPLTIGDIKEKLLAQKGKYLDLDILVGSKAKSPVRLIASLLPEEQTQKRLKRKKDNRTHLSKLTQESACLNLFLTNVERRKYDAAQICGLYSIRWQIELMFKTWKSIIQLHNIHPMNPTRFQCVLLVKLIWIMLNWTLLLLIEQNQLYEISFHKLSRTLVSRSQLLTLKLIQDQRAFFHWLMHLSDISRRHHRKEYKKGDHSLQEIIRGAT